MSWERKFELTTFTRNIHVNNPVTPTVPCDTKTEVSSLALVSLSKDVVDCSKACCPWKGETWAKTTKQTDRVGTLNNSYRKYQSMLSDSYIRQTHYPSLRATLVVGLVISKSRRQFLVLLARKSLNADGKVKEAETRQLYNVPPSLPNVFFSKNLKNQDMANRE